MIQFRHFALAAPIALAMASCTPPPGELFAQGEAAFEARDYRKARIQLASGLKGEPGNTAMQVLLARTLVKLGNGEGAVAQIEAMDPPVRAKQSTRTLLGEAHVLSGQFDRAIEAVDGIEADLADRVRALAFIGKTDLKRARASFETGMKRDNPAAVLIADYARFEFEQGRWNATQTLVEQALKADPDRIEAILVRADLLERRNELPESLAQHRAVLALEQGNFNARLGEARVLAKMGRGKQALAIAEQLQAIAPESPQVAAVRASVAAQGLQWGKVRQLLQPFETGLGRLPGAAILYAEALVELGLPGQALSYLSPLFKQQPGWRGLRGLYARAALESGDAGAAFDAMEPLAVRPDATKAELQLAARIAEAVGDKRAERFAKRAQTPAPERIGGELARADRALRNKQWSEAEAAYLAILDQVAGGNALTLNNLAYAQGRLGKTEQALGHALKAVELEPENASILDTAAVLLVESGSREEGLAMLEKAAAIAPRNASVQRHLSQLRKP